MTWAVWEFWQPRLSCLLHTPSFRIAMIPFSYCNFARCLHTIILLATWFLIEENGCWLKALEMRWFWKCGLPVEQVQFCIGFARRTEQ